MRELKWTDPASPDADCPYDHVSAETPFGTIRITWKGWKDYPSYDVDVHPIADFFESYDTLEDAKKGASDAFKAALHESLGEQSVEDILKLVCLHTGQRVSLSEAQLDEYIAFARCLESRINPDLLALAANARSMSEALAADPNAALKVAQAFFPQES